MAYVYKITSPTNKVYIGSTKAKNITTRWNRYFKHDCKTQTKLFRSFLKYGVKNHKFEIIWEGDESIMLEKEREFGELYNVLKKGLNLCLPKLGEKYGGKSETTKKRMSDSAKNYWTDEVKENFSNKRKGLKYSDEAKLRMKNGQTKRYENRLLVCYSNDETIVESFNFIKDAASKYNVPSSSICVAIKKGTKSAGYYWKYVIKDSQ